MTTAATLHERLRKYLGTKGTKYQDFYIIANTYINLRHKAQASYHRRSKRHEFGIPKLHWDRYVELAKEGKCVYSLIVEENTSLIYCARIIDLGAVARVYSGDAIDKGGTVFVPRDRYKVMNQ